MTTESKQTIINNLRVFSRNYPYFKLEDEAGEHLVQLWVDKYSSYSSVLLEKSFGFFLENWDKAPTISDFGKRIRHEQDSFNNARKSISDRNARKDMENQLDTPDMTPDERQGRHNLIKEMFSVFEKYSILENIGITVDEALISAKEYAEEVAESCLKCGYSEPDKKETTNYQYNAYLAHCVDKVKAVKRPEPSQNVTVPEVETNDEFEGDIPF